MEVGFNRGIEKLTLLWEGAQDGQVAENKIYGS